MLEGGEPLLDGGGDGPEHQDQRQVHPPQQRPPQHAGLLVEARDVEGDGVEALVGPRDREELLPPAGRHVGHVEAQHEGQWNHVQECIEVLHYTFK